jgi:hypothetical protein
MSRDGGIERVLANMRGQGRAGQIERRAGALGAVRDE